MWGGIVANASQEGNLWDNMLNGKTDLRHIIVVAFNILLTYLPWGSDVPRLRKLALSLISLLEAEWLSMETPTIKQQ